MKMHLRSNGLSSLRTNRLESEKSLGSKVWNKPYRFDYDSMPIMLISTLITTDDLWKFTMLLSDDPSNSREDRPEKEKSVW